MWRVDPQPLGEVGLVVTQTVVLLAGAAIGVGVARRRAGAPGSRRGRGRRMRAAEPATLVVGTALALGVMAVTAV